jgi:uncharacterized protein YlxW (UPF0749 family)
VGIIKRSINIIAFLLVFLVTASVVNGADAGIDENTIYDIKSLSKYSRSIGEMKLLIKSMQNAVDNEKKSLADYEAKKYMDEIVELNSQIEQIKFFNGFTDVRGPGIMLRVSDNISEDTDIGLMERIVHDVDIVVLLNDLKAAGTAASRQYYRVRTSFDCLNVVPYHYFKRKTDLFRRVLSPNI